MKYACLITIGLIAVFLMQCKVYQKPEKLDERLQELCKSYPPEFRQLRSPRSFIKDDRGTYSLAFSSNLSYAQVKDYYSGILSADGWKINEQSSYNISGFKETRYLSFTKEPFSIHVEASSLEANDTEKVFLLNCSWNAY